MFRVVITNHGRYGELVASDMSYRVPYSIFPTKKDAVTALTYSYKSMLKDLRKSKPHMEYTVKHKAHIATITRRDMKKNIYTKFKDFDVFEVVSSDGQLSSNSTFEYRGYQISPVPDTSTYLVRKMDELGDPGFIAETLHKAFCAVDSKFNRAPRKPRQEKNRVTAGEHPCEMKPQKE